MCDFAVCNYTSLGDGICNPECRNKNCKFDYCDCFDLTNIDDVSEFEQDQCGYNQTLCASKTDCFVSVSSWNWQDNINSTYDLDLDSLEIDSWVGDGICDDNCDNIYCDYDVGDCQECGGSGCYEFWYYFDAAANFDTYDYKISQLELCTHWDVIKRIMYHDREPQFNCSQTLVVYDLNNDTLLNPFEGLRMIYNEYDHSDAFVSLQRAEQINCSLCAPSVEIYYN